ncbi:MAG: DEAD/DEAH box helicase [bacterium]|nr:DEAD/DEAH box helicase [bacterium]
MAVLLLFDKKLALKCSFDEKELAKSVPGWKWNGEMKVWEYPVEKETVDQLKSIFPNLKIAQAVRDHIKRIERKRMQLLELKQVEDVELGVPFADKLRNYQRVGAHFLNNTSKCILADDMGTGKTLQAITACEDQGAERVLVVCPNTLKWNWFDEIDKWTDSKAVVVDGAKKKREKAISEFQGKYLIINYEALRLHEELQNIEWDVLILDEAHKIKNRKAQQTKAAKKLKANRVYLLSGTPMLNRPDELWSLLNRLYPDKFRSYWRFVERYCSMVDNGWGKDIGIGTSEQQEELKRLLAPIMLRRTKQEVLTELPDKIHQRHLVELKGKQAEAYKTMEEDAIATLTSGETIAAPVVIAQITRLRQIAISTQLLSDQVAESAKFEVLLELIQDNKDNHKIVVFSQFRKAVELFSKKLDEAGIKWVAVTGKVKQDDRHQATKSFQEDIETRVMLATIEAAAHGLTWTAADIAVFLDRHWTPAINTQAEDRLHRIGQKNSVTIINLVAKGTVEEYIEWLLEKKKEGFDNIINGQVTAEDLKQIFGMEIAKLQGGKNDEKSCDSSIGTPADNRV